MFCWISEPLILRIDDAGSGLLLRPRARSAGTTRSCVISSALSSTSIAATFIAKRSSSISGLSPARSLAAARDAASFVAEQEFGAVPALVFFVDAVLDRHLHVVEEHLVDFMAAVDGL